MAKHTKDPSRPAGDPGELAGSDIPDLEDILGEFEALDLEGWEEDSPPAAGAETPAEDAVPARPPEKVPAGEESAPEAEKLPDAFPNEQDLPAFFSGSEETGSPVPEREPVKKPAPKRKPAGTQKKKAPAKGKKRRRRSRRKKDRFKAGLIVYLLLWAIVIVALLVTLWNGLDRSQKRIDAENEALARQRAEEAARQAHERAVYRAPQLAFEEWLAGADAEYWTELWYRDRDGDLDGRDRVKEHLSSLFTSAEAFKALDYTAGEPVYVLKNGEERLAEIRLSGSDVNWSVSDVRLLIEGREKASVRVASGSRVYCNGVALGPDYIVDSSSYFTYEPLRDKLVNPVTWDTYEVSGLLLEPALTADPPEGGIVTETSEGDFLLCLDEAAGKPYQTRAVNFVKAYLNYYLNGYNGTWGNLYAALAYLTPGYQAYKDLQDTYNGVVWNSPYTNVDTSLTNAGDVVIWADNCYSTDVIYDAKGIQNGQQGGYAATMRIYFLKTDAGFIISNFEIL